MGWLAKPDATLTELEQSLGNAGTPITRQAVEQRLDQPQTADFFKALLEATITIQLESTGVPTSLLARFSHVYLVDSTIITLPNSLSEVWRGSGAIELSWHKALPVIQRFCASLLRCWLNHWRGWSTWYRQFGQELQRVACKDKRKTGACTPAILMEGVLS